MGKGKKLSVRLFIHDLGAVSDDAEKGVGPLRYLLRLLSEQNVLPCDFILHISDILAQCLCKLRHPWQCSCNVNNDGGRF